MLKIEDLWRSGRAFYEFIEVNGAPTLEIKIYTATKRFKAWRVTLPTTESDMDLVDQQITKLIEAIHFEDQRRAEQQRRELLKAMTPEQIKLLNLDPKEHRYEG